MPNGDTELIAERQIWNKFKTRIYSFCILKDIVIRNNKSNLLLIVLNDKPQILIRPLSEKATSKTKLQNAHLCTRMDLLTNAHSSGP